MESILTSVKKMLGIEESYTHFDSDIIMCINTVLFTLNQIGVGPVKTYSISDSSNTWVDFLGDTLLDLQAVKSYVFLKVKVMFDPPTSSFVLDAYNKQAEELEWRLNVQVETDGLNQNELETKLDYTKLKNLPTINGEPLIDNYDEKDPTIEKVTTSEFEDMWSKHFDN